MSLLCSVLVSGMPFCCKSPRTSTIKEKDSLCIRLLASVYSAFGCNAVVLFKREFKIRSSEGSDEKLMSMNEDLFTLSFVKYSGCFLESVLSFGVVSYCMISGTVSEHKDISKPSSFEYLCWMLSFIAIFYKNSQI